MPKKTPVNSPVEVLPNVPTDTLVNSFLRRLSTLPDVEDRKMEQWRYLEKTQPEITRFIMTCSYRSAPHDPEARAAVASNMLYLYILLGEAKLHEEVSQLFADSAGEYFSTQ